MNYSLQLMMALPELVLAIGAVFLLLVAAWGGTQSTKLVSWTAIAVLIGAGIALAGPASAGGEAFRRALSPRHVRRLHQGADLRGRRRLDPDRAALLPADLG